MKFNTYCIETIFNSFSRIFTSDMAEIKDDVSNPLFSVCGFTPGKQLWYSDESMEFIKSGKLQIMLESIFKEAKFYLKSLNEKETMCGTFDDEITSMMYTLFAVVYSKTHEKHFCVVFDTDEVLIGRDSFDFQRGPIYISNTDKGPKVCNYHMLHQNYVKA